MTVIVHGTAGGSVHEAAEKYGRDSTRRGEYFERVTGGVLERWLSSRPGTFHLFHDLTRLDTAGHGYGRLNLGVANIDHLILTGSGWLTVDAKGTGAGRLTLDTAGHGVLVQGDEGRPQPWMDSQRWYSMMGAVVRLTGLHGWHLFAVSDKTRLDPEIQNARCMARPGSLVINLGDLASGKFEAWLADQGMGELLEGLPVPDELVAALAAHVTEAPPIPA